MPKSNKYSALIEAIDNTWRAQIVRQASSRKVVVSKSQDGFSTEAEAQAWAEKHLQEFTRIQQESNKRHSEKRQQAKAPSEPKS